MVNTLNGVRTQAIAKIKKHWFISSLVVLIGIYAFLTRDRSVSWEEEVLLNTGQTIWVKRTVVYSQQGGAGNPLDVMYRPKSHQISFDWNGKNYIYKRGGVMVLAIASTGKPALVGKADSGAWNFANEYKCTIPFYVQFIPDDSGTAWTWPASIEPFLYNLPTNLFGSFGNPDDMLPRYTVQQKSLQRYLADPQLVSSHKIDPAYTGDLCKPKEK